LVVISALLEANPTPSDPEIKAAIDGNLCRCTGYQQIVDSVRAASEIITSESQTPDPTEAHSDPHPGLALESAHTSTDSQVPETEATEATSTGGMEPASTQERGE
jgi:xanthine dehydrogenase iron-sulfur cluster and FAD-binding subunit A